MAWVDVQRHGINKLKTLRVVTGTNPAAGSEISETVPAGFVWEIISMAAVFVTDATVANRVVTVVLDDSSNEIFRHNDNTSHTASLSVTYSFARVPVQSGALAFNTLTLPIPQIPLGPGSRIRTATTSIQAGDNWGAPTLLVLESTA